MTTLSNPHDRFFKTVFGRTEVAAEFLERYWPSRRWRRLWTGPRCARRRKRYEARLPEWMQTEEMKQAMSTLQGFSDQERAYHRYQARQDYLRQQKSIENYMKAIRAEVEQARAAEEQARAAEEQARAAEEQALAEKEAALAEIARLKAQLQGH